jgi:hypothetical protein
MITKPPQLTYKQPLLLQHQPSVQTTNQGTDQAQDRLVCGGPPSPVLSEGKGPSSGVKHNIVSTAQVLSFPQAKQAAEKLGAALHGLRVQLPPSGAETPDFATVAAGLFGPGKPSEPAFPESALRLTSNWGIQAAYPQFVVDPKSGEVFMHAADRSEQWFGPYLPPKGARIIGTFTPEQNLELGVIISTNS